MKQKAHISLIVLLALLIMLVGCANNRTARNTRDDGIMDNGNGMTDNNNGWNNNNNNGWDNNTVTDGVEDNNMGYDNGNNDLDLTPGDENIFDGNQEDREENVRRGITTQFSTRTLPNITNNGANNRVNNTTGNVKNGNTADQARTNTNRINTTKNR